MYVLMWEYASEIPFNKEKNLWYRNHMIFPSREEAIEYYEKFLIDQYGDKCYVRMYHLRETMLNRKIQV